MTTNGARKLQPSQAGSSPAEYSPEAFAREIAGLAWSKKAEDVVIIDLRERHSVFDFFVIATAPVGGRLAQVLGEEAYTLAKRRFGPSNALHLESSEEWVCADLGDVVLHVFSPQAREFYGLEHLWGDAPRTPVNGPFTAAATR